MSSQFWSTLMQLLFSFDKGKRVQKSENFNSTFIYKNRLVKVIQPRSQALGRAWERG
jgi:hypothetical protein